MTSSALLWIVDDSPTQAAVIARTFDDVCEIETFADGAAMLERLGVCRRHPDLLLIDWVMPGLSGDELCHFVRSNAATAEIPIVILTASRTDTADIVRAFESGASEYVAKPFMPEELRARVGALLRTRQLKTSVESDARRVRMIARLGRSLLEAGTDVRTMVLAVAEALIADVCDGCAISLPALTEIVSRRVLQPTVVVPLLALPGGARAYSSDADALAALPQASEYIAHVGLAAVLSTNLIARGIAEGTVIVTRDGGGRPFDEFDMIAIEASLQLAGLAIESAVRASTERRAFEFQQKMVGVVSHDLRTPISAIAMAVDLLRPALQQLPDARTLERIGRSSTRMGDIVERLLDVTRTRLGEGIEITRQTVDLMDVASRVIDELRLSHPTAVFALAGDATRGAWDPDRLEQVLSNLVSNAVQYGRVGAPVCITIFSLPSTVAVEVSNEIQTAPISEATLTAIFDPFKRGDSNDHKAGLGLGLYIVNEIVVAHAAR